MTTKLSDQWCTPPALFKELDAEFHFDIDLCATEENAQCDSWYSNYLTGIICTKARYTEAVCHLAQSKSIKCAFMNPPYSNPKPFIEKAWEDSKHCKIVCLVKCDPSTRWWATFWNYDVDKGPKQGCEVRFFPKRIKFVPPEGLDGSSGPTFPCALIIMDRRLG